ncbi:MAG: hypothetical protein U5O39_20650 [Gammaproteobacteria bacterium]|nr:hypothetical protein [Gammaproteobacteria bacterium]
MALGDGADAEAIFSAIKRGAQSFDRSARSRHQFRIRLEPGIREGSTEIYLEHKRLANASMIATTSSTGTESPTTTNSKASFERYRVLPRRPP